MQARWHAVPVTSRRPPLATPTRSPETGRWRLRGCRRGWGCHRRPGNNRPRRRRPEYQAGGPSPVPGPDAERSRTASGVCRGGKAPLREPRGGSRARSGLEWGADRRCGERAARRRRYRGEHRYRRRPPAARAHDLRVAQPVSDTHLDRPVVGPTLPNEVLAQTWANIRL
jgi:hypothetical protein